MKQKPRALENELSPWTTPDEVWVEAPRASEQAGLPQGIHFADACATQLWDGANKP